MIRLKKCNWLDDWYTIEGIGSDACVEGSKEEMLALASAIESRSSESFRRCAAILHKTRYAFYSPRNSRITGYLSFEKADTLAKEIKEKLL